ncbi:hypothetical protein Enr8_47260 [Blastopirellula retiformator]|uniref:Uncharacterized protein n=1 Tax=Blastopirellula retiformator TaxID=2527970 RepID=A0A5C5UW25_9BACT|nr:hypothetical protein Enr8_47260 [Blastopirellula retiformator]
MSSPSVNNLDHRTGPFRFFTPSGLGRSFFSSAPPGRPNPSLHITFRQTGRDRTGRFPFFRTPSGLTRLLFFPPSPIHDHRSTGPDRFAFFRTASVSSWVPLAIASVFLGCSGDRCSPSASGPPDRTVSPFSKVEWTQSRHFFPSPTLLPTCPRQAHTEIATAQPFRPRQLDLSEKNRNPRFSQISSN